MGKITAIIVGAGHRSMKYASYALEHSDRLSIVGVVDPNPIRRAQAAAAHALPEDRCFADLESLLAKGKLADCAINGTMDRLHIPTSVPLLAAGYDLLLGKPISTNKEDLILLLNTARKHKRKVLICHVLRYAPTYRKIKKALLAGELAKF